MYLNFNLISNGKLILVRILVLFAPWRADQNHNAEFCLRRMYTSQLYVTNMLQYLGTCNHCLVVCLLIADSYDRTRSRTVFEQSHQSKQFE